MGHIDDPWDHDDCDGCPDCWDQGPTYPDNDDYCPTCGQVKSLITSKLKGNYEMCNHCGWTSFQEERERKAQLA